MKNLIGIILLISSLWSCSPRFRVGSDSAPGVDLSKYQTFRKDPRNLFTKRSNAILNSELTKKRIDYSIGKELAAKGYELTDQNADLVFSYQTEVKQKQEVNQSNPNMMMPMGWGYYNWRWGAPMMQNQTTVRNYEETTLIIDIRDLKTGELVWQGWIIGELKYSETRWAESIEATVKRALASFPSKKKE
ncbi:MAG: DUF4136 domain-containing protein [Microscillaceae bacterium]|jgi:hypothetical protein|nr:DUF4136 domain-containing protein [Microscillaceae bacterium]